MDRQDKRRDLEVLRERVRALEADLARADAPTDAEWPPRGFYMTYYVLGGFVLGIFGACTSLLFNVVGSLLTGRHPLELVRIYLTFPLGRAALEVNDGLTLAVGCCLYLFTGMVLGIPFHVMLCRWFAGAPFGTRLLVASVMALALWLFNYYALLSWLQPALFGGNWITADIPLWVAALTHLVFGWTMVLVQPMGEFVVRTRPPAEAS